MQQTTPEVHPDAGRSTRVSALRRHQLAVSAAVRPRGRFRLVKDIQRGNHDLTKARNRGTLVKNSSNLWRGATPPARHGPWMQLRCDLQNCEGRKCEMRQAMRWSRFAAALVLGWG